MTDDEVLDTVKRTLADVRMDRSVGAIEQRGRARRRHRGLVGALVGGGLAAAAALAIALPMVARQPGPVQNDSADNGPVVTAPAMAPAAFTLTKQADGSTKLVLNYKQVLDPKALQKELAAAGIPAVVKTDVLCTPKGQQLPEAKQVFRVKEVIASDGSASWYDLIINGPKMPAGSVVYFSVFAVHPGDGYDKVAQFLVTKNAPMDCQSIG